MRKDWPVDCVWRPSDGTAEALEEARLGASDRAKEIRDARGEYVREHCPRSKRRHMVRKKVSAAGSAVHTDNDTSIAVVDGE